MQVGLPSPKRVASRENVRVVCRVRPQNTKEIAMGGIPCVTTTHEMIDIIDDNSHNNFSFDKVFGFESTQQEVFEETAVPLVKDVLNGYNATIFAYGQTGTGKTHTMEGNIRDPELKGIIPRVVEALFDGVGETDDNIEFTFIVSYVEIYMEKIRDLLDDTKLKNNLSVREDKIKGLYIAGVTEEYVTSVEELLEIMSAGAHNRATAATGMNEGSSRSHSVFTITVSQLDTKTKASKSGKLVLVDLAGSETVRKTGASGQQLEEAKTINKIKQLENNSKTVTSNMRQQAERHVAELSNLREQIQMLRTEHQKRIEMIKSNESTNDKNLSTAFSFRHSEQPRSIRGGVSFAVDKSVRGGKNKNIFNTISEDQSNDGSNQNEDVDESPTKRLSVSSTGGFLSKLLGNK
eukprot:gene17350-22897_t